MGALNPGGAFILLGAAALVWAFSKTNGVSMSVPEFNTDTGDNNKKNRNEKQHNVYVLKNKATGTIEYVGRTTDLDTAKYRHSRNPARSDLKIESVAENISRETARGLEQMLIMQCGIKNKFNPANNQINGVSPSNKSYSIYWDAATYWVDNHETPCR